MKNVNGMKSEKLENAEINLKNLKISSLLSVGTKILSRDHSHGSPGSS